MANLGLDRDLSESQTNVIWISLRWCVGRVLMAEGRPGGAWWRGHGELGEGGVHTADRVHSILEGERMEY